MASLLGDKSRALMLWNLLDGRAYTATELSLCADLSPQSASNHLAKLVSANILTVEKQGRHRYYRYANPEVAQVMETMAGLLPLSQQLEREQKLPAVGITYARTCYDHIAGKLGVAMTDAFLQKGILEAMEKNYELTPLGKDWLHALGINVAQIQLQKRPFAYACLDWSERRHHLAGALGAALLQHMLSKDWIRRIKHSREILITPTGKMELRNSLNLEM